MSEQPAPALSCPAPVVRNDRVLLGHGSGGRLSAELIEKVFVPAFDNEVLSRLEDQAILSVGASRIAFTTDSFVVKPIIFRGGDLGSLAVNGTINDLAVGGATPKWLSCAFIIEEGFKMSTLARIVDSVKRAADEAGVMVVTGDTKVVERGSVDGLFLNTTGIGVVTSDVSLSVSAARPGDVVLINGPIGDHGIAVMATREGLKFETPVESDSAPLHGLVAKMLEANSVGIRALRDPTRGGLSSALNEISKASQVGIELDEKAIPLRPGVLGACEMLGLDPLYVANEGKLIAIVDESQAGQVLDAMRSHPLGRLASIIGRITNGDLVTMRTSIGTTRIVDMLAGDQLPRIC